MKGDGFREDCAFCRLIAGEREGRVVHEDEYALAFLDARPVFHGHCLVVPKRHVELLDELPDELIEPLFSAARFMSRAVRRAMDAEGTFVAMNNTISQSVPHLHVHVVPRRRKDGLRGFFWPRHPYEDEAQAEETAERVRREVRALLDG